MSPAQRPSQKPSEHPLEGYLPKSDLSPELQRQQTELGADINTAKARLEIAKRQLAEAKKTFERTSGTVEDQPRLYPTMSEAAIKQIKKENDEAAKALRVAMKNEKAAEENLSATEKTLAAFNGMPEEAKKNPDKFAFDAKEGKWTAVASYSVERRPRHIEPSQEHRDIVQGMSNQDILAKMGLKISPGEKAIDFGKYTSWEEWNDFLCEAAGISPKDEKDKMKYVAALQEDLGFSGDDIDGKFGKNTLRRLISSVRKADYEMYKFDSGKETMDRDTFDKAYAEVGIANNYPDKEKWVSAMDERINSIQKSDTMLAMEGEPESEEEYDEGQLTG